MNGKRGFIVVSIFAKTREGKYLLYWIFLHDSNFSIFLPFIHHFKIYLKWCIQDTKKNKSFEFFIFMLMHQFNYYIKFNTTLSPINFFSMSPSILKEIQIHNKWHLHDKQMQFATKKSYNLLPPIIELAASVSYFITNQNVIFMLNTNISIERACTFATNIRFFDELLKCFSNTL